MSLYDLKTIRDRCVDEGECWMWAQHTQSAGYPTASHEGKNTLVRRRAFELAFGYLPHPRQRAIAMTCKSVLCVNPEHMKDMSRPDLLKLIYKTRNTDHEYPARLAARIRQGTKLSLEIARELRASAPTETAKVAAARLGVSASLVSKIRQGHMWREGAANNSVFNMKAGQP